MLCLLLHLNQRYIFIVQRSHTLTHTNAYLHTFIYTHKLWLCNREAGDYLLILFEKGDIEMLTLKINLDH